MPDYSSSGDEDDDNHSDCPDFSISLGCIVGIHFDGMAKMISAVVQEQ